MEFYGQCRWFTVIDLLTTFCVPQQSLFSQSASRDSSECKTAILSGVFHAITGANGRFRTGEILDVNAEGVDVYDTMTAALGAVHEMGSSDRQVQRINILLC
ncbi:MAG: hypothetical protein VYB72_10340 [Planctomycetota bacterium]|nr:hypothetical protein [Planctomycetota bacterium]